jgi:hypothetical protein
MWARLLRGPGCELSAGENYRHSGQAATAMGYDGANGCVEAAGCPEILSHQTRGTDDIVNDNPTQTHDLEDGLETTALERR